MIRLIATDLDGTLLEKGGAPLWEQVLDLSPVHTLTHRVAV